MDGTGEMLIPLFAWGEQLVEAVESAEEFRTENPGKEPPQWMLNGLSLFVLVEGPGYARQLFTIPLATAESGQTMRLDMKREARIRGRLVLAGTGEPLTSGSAMSLIEAHGTEQDRAAFARHLEAWGGRPFFVTFMHASIDDFSPGSTATSTTFQKHVRIPIDEQGRFEYDGLLPGGHWAMQFSPTGLTNITRRDIELQAGLNDFGDIVVGHPGAFAGAVTDENLVPLESAIVYLIPGQDPKRKGIRTDEAGEFSMGLEYVSGGRQIVHVIPPWGYKQSKNLFTEDIWLEAVMHLDPLRGTWLTCVAARGSTMTLSLAATPEREQIAEYYSRPESLMHYEPTESFRRLRDGEDAEIYFAGWRAALIALEPDASGMVYHGQRTISSGLPFEPGEAMEFEMPHVPPGHYAARIDAGYFVPQRVPKEMLPEEVVYYEEPIHGPTIWLTIAYAEIEMGDEPVTHELLVNFTDVVIDLEGWPIADSDEAEFPQTLIFLDRTEPLTASLGPTILTTLGAVSRSGGRDPEERFLSFVGYAGAFIRSLPGEEMNMFKQVYRSAEFRAVPAGRYRLRAYADIFQLIGSDPKPYYETEIEIAPDGASLALTIPYKKPAPRNYDGMSIDD